MFSVTNSMLHIVTRMASTSVNDLKAGDKFKVIEVKVYRKWISTNPPNPTPTGYCCMLLDKLVRSKILKTDLFISFKYFHINDRNKHIIFINTGACDSSKYEFQQYGVFQSNYATRLSIQNFKFQL